MIRSISISAALLSFTGACVPVARLEAQSSSRPAAPDTAAFHYDVDGVRVIQKVITTGDVVAVNAYLLGGVRQLTAATQGIESLYLEAAKLGTRSYPDAVIRRAWAETGSSYLSDASTDWSLVAFRGLRQDFDSSWNIFADRIAHPRLSRASVNQARERLVAGIRLTNESPDGEVASILDSLAYAGHAYSLRPDGSEESLARLDSAALASYVAANVVQSRLLIVVVGNVTRERVEAAVRRTFASLPRGSYAWTLPQPAPARSGSPVLVHRILPTNYIIGLMDGPPSNDPDLAAYQMATAILGGRISSAVREAQGLSYHATAYARERGLTSATIYATTTRPDTVVRMMRGKVDSVRLNYYTRTAVRWMADQYVTGFLGRSQTSAGQANALGSAQILKGDYRQFAKEMLELQDVAGGEMKGLGAKYFKDPFFVYLGDTTRIGRDAFVKR